jgi:hypothetical protein
LKNSRPLVLLSLILLSFFIYGVVKLFLLRFERGDVYPAYSSLRADPLGTKAFYDSLKNLQDLTVGRNYRSLSRLHHSPKATVFYLGTRVGDLGLVRNDLLKAFDELVSAGGRLVISFFPVKGKAWMRDWSDFKRSGNGKKAEKDKAYRGEAEQSTEEVVQPLGRPSTSEGTRKIAEMAEDHDSGTRVCEFVSFADHWGLRFGFDAMVRDSEDGSTARKVVGENLPDSISWHTGLYFDQLDRAWQVIYSREGHPVITERMFGRGTIVLCADSYLFSNEALRIERRPGLLAWFMGGHTRIVFDEVHLGVQEYPGIAGLVRKYRLHGLLIGFVFLVGLFVWKNAFCFVPPSDDPSVDANDADTERDYTAGFVSLLRRNISDRDILSVCFREWEKSFPPSSQDPDDKRERMRRVIDAQKARAMTQRNPIEAYRTIQRILAERKNP